MTYFACFAQGLNVIVKVTMTNLSVIDTYENNSF